MSMMMTNKELSEIAQRLSGLPPRKNKHGAGAYAWLAKALDVHPSTVSRWLRGKDNSGSDVPQWAIDDIEKLKAAHEKQERGQEEETEIARCL